LLIDRNALEAETEYLREQSDAGVAKLLGHHQVAGSGERAEHNGERMLHAVANDDLLGRHR
jgi:hypothetical protein